MDPDTERRLAAMIMEEATRLRAEADRDGVAAYLAKPKARRSRANPQFLQATVRSVQQSNRIVEVNEMWRRRNVELEDEQGRNHRWRRNDSHGGRRDGSQDPDVEPQCRPVSDSEDTEEDGLSDEELEQFLHSRLKRGRGAVGSRMDETGPYLPAQTEMQLRRTLTPDERTKRNWEDRVVGPLPGPSLSGAQVRDWSSEKWKCNQGDPRIQSREDVKLHARHKDRKDKKRRMESNSTKKHRKSEKSSKLRS